MRHYRLRKLLCHADCNGSSLMDDDRCGQRDITKIMCEEIAMSC